jgi:MFS family permease
MTILRVPGAWQFCAAGLLARAGGAMLGIGIILMVRGLYGEYGLAGAVSAVHTLCFAAGSPVIAAFVDRFGQRRIMLPTMTASAIAVAGLVVVAGLRAPGWSLVIPAALAGLTAGSVGPLVRARWAHVLSTPGHLHTAYSLEGALDEATFIVGPVVATVLATEVTPTAGLIAPIVLSLAGALTFFAQRGTEPPVRRDAASPSPGHRPARGRPAVLIRGVAPVGAVCLALGCLFGASDLTVVASVEAWGSAGSAGVVLAAFSTASMTAGLAYGARSWVAPLWKRFVISTYALLLGGLLLLATSPVTLAVFGFVTGLSVAPTLINATTLVQHLVPPARLTEGLTWINTALGVGVSIGAGLSGLAVDHIGPTAGFVIVLVVGVVAAAIATASARTLRRASVPAPMPP